MMSRFLFFCLVWICASASASAHEVRPAYLEIRETEPSVYNVLWKTPAQGEMRLALNVILPPDCHMAGAARTTLVNAAVLQRWRSICDAELPGQKIRIENLEKTLTDVILRFEPVSGAPKTLRMTSASPEVVIPFRQTFWEIANTYFRIGVEHILFGFDHLLFVLCLLVLVGNAKRLIGVVSAFTIAHSLTLAGTTFGWLTLASTPVEAAIALSIVFVAAEIIRAREGKPGVTARWPWIASLGFGLLHGFGFAGALREIGLPESAAPLALVFFNLGVEAGQLIFIAAALTVMFGWRRLGPTTPAWAWRTTPYVVGSLASFWFIERIARILL